MNKVQIIGNLTKNPEIKVTQSGSKLAKFSVATNSGYKDKDGSQIETPEFHNITIFGKLAEVAEKYLGKGQKVFIEGRLKTDKWEDQAGAKRYSTGIICENLMMLSFKNRPQEQQEQQEQATQEQTMPSKVEFDHGDLPF